MNKLEKFTNALARRSSQLGEIAMVLAMGVIVTNIVMRAVWKPLPGSYELVEIMGAVILSLGVGYCAVARGHVTVTLMVDKLSIRKQAAVDMLTSLISLVFISAVGWGLLRYAGTALKKGLETSTLSIPLYPVYLLVAAGLILLAMTALVEFLKSIAVVFNKRTYKP